jgi:hypothetical protein
MRKNNFNYQRGQAMMVATIFFLVVSMTIIFGLVNPILRQQKIASSLTASKESYFLAEAGIEDAAYRLINGLPIESTETIDIGEESATLAMSDLAGGKEVVSTADVRQAVRKVKASLLLGMGATFNYGVQVGAGGFTLSNNAGVNGNIYSNSTVTGANGAFVTGSVVAVNSINRVRVGTGSTGDAKSPRVTNSTVRGSLYCSTGSGNNKPCNTTFSLPLAQNYPLTNEEIELFKTHAEAGGTIGSQIISGEENTLGPVKIDGNLTISTNSKLTATGAIWVTGNLLVENGAELSLDEAYETMDGVLVVDGTSTLSNGSTMGGSGEEGSYLMLLSTSSSANAVTVANNAGAIIIYAPNGGVQLNNNTEVRQLTAKNISLNNGAIINYIQGVINASFSTGPGGTYTISRWKETE